jgi:hypothetical protein
MRLSQNELNKILEDHKVYLSSYGASGVKANLQNVDLSGLDLSYADLRSADLRSADLSYADLRSADLSYADLSYADLRYADLSYADLRSADLPENTFIITGEHYAITICNGEYVRAGCQNHTVEGWFNMTREEVINMDGRTSLRYYPRLLDIIDLFIPASEKRIRPEWLLNTETEAV